MKKTIIIPLFVFLAPIILSGMCTLEKQPEQINMCSQCNFDEKLITLDKYFELVVTGKTYRSCRCLYLRFSNLSDEQKARIVGLDISHCEGIGEAVKWIAKNKDKFPNLTSLKARSAEYHSYYFRPKVFDSDIRDIADIKTLTHLDLYGNDLWANFLRPLSKLTNLKRLNLGGNPIGRWDNNSAGGTAALMIALSKLPNLTELKINSLPPQEHTFLKAFLPGTNVVTIEPHQFSTLESSFSTIIRLLKRLCEPSLPETCSKAKNLVKSMEILRSDCILKKYFGPEAKPSPPEHKKVIINEAIDEIKVLLKHILDLDRAMTKALTNLKSLSLEVEIFGLIVFLQELSCPQTTSSRRKELHKLAENLEKSPYPRLPKDLSFEEYLRGFRNELIDEIKLAFQSFEGASD